MSDWSVVCLHLSALLCGTHVVGEHACAVASDDVNTGVSCTFQRDGCGWRTSSHSPTWKRSYEYYRNGYVEVRMDLYVENSTAYLYSPWLCPTVADYHTLHFRYLIKNDYRCLLSVYVKNVTSFNGQQIWNTAKSSGSSLNYILTTLEIPSQDNTFQIIFEAKKFPDGATPRSKCISIQLDDIQYERIPQPSTTSKSITPQPSTVIPIYRTQTAVTIHLTSEQTIDLGNSESVSSHTAAEDSGGGRGVGAAVGIIVGVISVVVIIVVIVVFLRRQQNGSKDCSSMFDNLKKRATPEQKVIQEVANAADGTVDLPVSNGSKMETTLHSGHGTPAYEYAATLHVIEDSPYKVSAGLTGAIYSKVIKTKDNASGHVEPTEDDYNKLSHQPPRLKPVGQHTNHAYNHQDDDMKNVPGQVTSTNEYSLALVDNENSVLPIAIIIDDHETNSHMTVPTKKDGEQNYVNVNSALKTPQQTTEAEYNRLDLDHTQKAQAAGLYNTEGYGVYNHLRGEDGEYHQLDFDHDRPHNVREHEDNTDGQDMYHHLQADAYTI